MYHTPYFKAPNSKAVMDFMHQHPFIILCGIDESGKPVATHIPVLIEEREEKVFLLAHVMRKQNHTRAFENNPNVLAVFHGAHTYVSASWYANKQVASTWNYQTVHASGILKFLDNEGLHNLLSRLTASFENNPDSPALVHKMDEAYVSKMMNAIVAFEIEVTDIQHTFKLSQNRNKEDYESVINHLSTEEADALNIANTMKEMKKSIYPS